MNLRAAAGATGLRMIALGITFIASILLARILGAEGRGYYQLAGTVAVFFALLGGFSVELGMSQVHANIGERRRIPLGTTVAASAYFWGLMLAALTPLALLIPSLHLDAYGPWGVTGAAALTLLTLVTAWTQRILLIRGHATAAAASSVVDAATSSVGFAVLAYQGHLTAVSAIFASALGTLVATSMSTILIRPKVRDFRFDMAWRSVRAGLAFHPGQIALGLLIRFDTLILTALTGLRDVGIYAVAVSLTQPLAVFASALSSTFLHRQLTGIDANAVKSTISIMRMNMRYLVPLTIILGVLCPFAIPKVWGQAFSEAVIPLWILLPGTLAIAIQRPIGTFFVRLGLAKSLNFRAIVAVIANIALCFALIPPFGPNGAAAASTLTYVLYAAISGTLFQRSVNSLRGI